MIPFVCTIGRNLSKWTTILEAFAVIGAVMVVGGCDPTVPIYKDSNEGNVYFSLYGQVGPKGGTVRVERLRDSVNIGAPPLGSETVTLKRKKTRSVDTLRRERGRVGELPVHNYRVPPLKPGEEYQIAVEGRRGKVTSATVQVPVHRPVVTVFDSLQYCRPSRPGFPERMALPVQVRADSVERIGRVAATYTRAGISETGRHTVSANEIEGASFRIPIRTNSDLIDLFVKIYDPPDFEPPPPVFAEHMQVTVVAVGAEWPGSELNEAQLEEYATPGRYSNVRQGVGMVVGIHSGQADVPVGAFEPGKLPSCP